MIDNIQQKTIDKFLNLVKEDFKIHPYDDYYEMFEFYISLANDYFKYEKIYFHTIYDQVSTTINRLYRNYKRQKALKQ